MKTRSNFSVTLNYATSTEAATVKFMTTVVTSPLNSAVMATYFTRLSIPTIAYLQPKLSLETFTFLFRYILRHAESTFWRKFG